MKFTAKVLEIVKKIPKGHILTYKQVAQKAGSVGSSRAVGSVLRKNYNLQIPCHRVICSSGAVSYTHLTLPTNREV